MRLNCRLMNQALVCWRCGASLSELPLPFGRLYECPSCSADVHVCLMCEFYDPTVAKRCREPVADEVKDKERANFCDYLVPKPDAYSAPDSSQAEAAKAQLDALFGEAPANGAAGAPKSEAEAAQAGLNDLFGLGGEEQKK